MYTKCHFCEMAKWSPIGGWLLIRVAAHSRFYCTKQRTLVVLTLHHHHVLKTESVNRVDNESNKNTDKFTPFQSPRGLKEKEGATGGFN